MKRLIIMTAAFGLWATTQAQTTELPGAFTTTKGKVIKNAKVLGRTDDALRISHNDGIGSIPFTELPAEVAELLGIDTGEDPNAIKLPNPLVASGKNYLETRLLAVEPDGIRILHDDGGAKLHYEDLPGALQLSLGGFDQEQALKFREAEEERQKAIKAEMYKQRLEMIDQRNKEAAGRGQPSTVPSPDVPPPTPSNQPSGASPRPNAPPASPRASGVSPMVLVEMTARSTGGRSGSGTDVRASVSFRNLECTLKSRSGAAQTARLQCLFLTRSEGGRMEAHVVADEKISIAPGGVQTVTTAAAANGGVISIPSFGLNFRVGEKYVGWSWRVVDGQGRICAVKSSTPPYDRHAYATPVEKR